jgi:hypothetical protein
LSASSSHLASYIFCSSFIRTKLFSSSICSFCAA